MIEDYYPTILEMAGITDYQTPQPIDGVSFVPLLKQTGDPSEDVACIGISRIFGLVNMDQASRLLALFVKEIGN